MAERRRGIRDSFEHPNLRARAGKAGDFSRLDLRGTVNGGTQRNQRRKEKRKLQTWHISIIREVIVAVEKPRPPLAAIVRQPGAGGWSKDFLPLRVPPVRRHVNRRAGKM